MANQCDNTSVGMIVRNDKDELLLIERKNEPYGFAPPAGHVDDHGSFEDAARAELEEEVGSVKFRLSGKPIRSPRRLLPGRPDPRFVRSFGDFVMRFHIWKFIKYVYSRPVVASALIGTSIHVLLEINGHVFAGPCHVAHIQQGMDVTPMYMSSYLLIPFLVPYMVTQIGRRIKTETEEKRSGC